MSGALDGVEQSPWWWEAAAPAPQQQALPEEAEVLIVGGGFTGLSAALTLARLGHRPVVVDAERIGWGASSRNGGTVSSGLKVPAAQLAERFGAERAQRMLDSAAAAFGFIEETIEREAIDCDYRRAGRFAVAWCAKHYDLLARRAEGVAKLTGLPTEMIPRSRQREEFGSDFYHGGMVAAASGSLHPAKYARGLAMAAQRAGAVLVDQTPVKAIRPEGSGFRVQAGASEVRAGAVIVGTNGYSRRPGGETAMPWLARRLIPVGSYLIATEELDPSLLKRLIPHNRVVFDTKRMLEYARITPDGKRLLWGGRTPIQGDDVLANARFLRRSLGTVLPELRDVRITHAWTGNIAMTFDTLPHIGEEGGIHYAAGYQGNGVAMSTWLGHNVGLNVAGRRNEDFALDGRTMPTRFLYRGRPGLALPVMGGWYWLRDRLDRWAG